MRAVLKSRVGAVMVRPLRVHFGAEAISHIFVPSMRFTTKGSKAWRRRGIKEKGKQIQTLIEMRKYIQENILVRVT